MSNKQTVVTVLATLAALAALGSIPCLAATSASGAVLKADFQALVRQHGDNPQRFAVPVDQTLNARTEGLWRLVGEQAIWTHTVSLPGATTMAFHADRLHIPDGATLSQAGTDGTRFEYGPEHNARGFLWSRPVAGNTLILEATMPAAARTEFVLHIAQFQAGYKSVGAPSSLAPTTQTVTPKAATGCDVNYACVKERSTNPDYKLAGRATLGVQFSNQILCTGSLLRDVGTTYKVFVETAAHCGNDLVGQGQTREQIAQATNFYWNAETPCGSALQNAVSPSTPVSFSATHRMLIYDHWLLEGGEAPPAGARPIWSGWDVSAVTPTGEVFGVHHGNYQTKQFMSSTNPVGRQGDAGQNSVWFVYTTEGHVIPGASGSGLFDISARYIGTLSGGNDRCPTEITPGNTQDAMFYGMFADAWVGTNTAATAARFWLDPVSSGVTSTTPVTQPSRENPPVVTIDSSVATVATGSPFTLTWSSTGLVLVCNATNSWTGSKASSGSQSITAPSTSGNYTYGLSCDSEGDTPGTDSVSVTVIANAATSFAFTSTANTIAPGGSVNLNWNAPNATTCTATNAWSGSKGVIGSESIMLASEGSYRFDLSCANTVSTTTKFVTVSVAIPPSGGGGGGGSIALSTLLVFLLRRLRVK